MKFYRCKKCGNFSAMVESSGAPMICCGEPMELLEAGTSDGAVEKHVPAVTANGKEIHVQVGEVMHPATEEHHITFVCLETNNGFQVKYIPSLEEPVATFAITDGEVPVAVYEYCNLHGLWKKEI
jgi:Desulfoferrodoxin